VLILNVLLWPLALNRILKFCSMAKLGGIIKLKGTIGDIAFYKSQDGYLAREKGGIPAERIKNDPAFQRTRENGEEFGRAGSAGKVLRNALRLLVQPIADSRMVSRLTQKMYEVVKADGTSTRGQRNVLDGELEMLKGFEFNARGLLSTTFYAPFVATVDRVTGALKIAIAAFIPTDAIAAPEGATHFRLVSAGASIDFEKGSFDAVSSNSADIKIDVVATAAIELLNQVPANSTHPLFLALGIEFLQEVNGVKYALANGNYNALALVGVSGI
jgi:hypothetical protein